MLKVKRKKLKVVCLFVCNWSDTRVKTCSELGSSINLQGICKLHMNM